MKKQKIKAILFDLDGTLIYSIPLHKKSFQLLFQEFGCSLKISEVSKYIRWSTEEIYQKLKVRERLDLDLEKFLQLRRKKYYSLISRKKLVFENRVKALKKLKKKYCLGLVTNSSRFSMERSTTARFRKLFNPTITFSDVLRGKPNPEMLLLACKKLRVKPSECILIGDSIVDVKAAKAAGIKVLAFYHKTGASSLSELRKTKPTKLIRNLRELDSFLKKIEN
ncbi:HAD family phosphatase [Candidatus Micrarchaeota archaeon]|nr:HAD family phosphatase [Candidatus Micrarchaeota archaeon]